MIQIIGFLICACLAIKVMEIMADARFLDENGERRPSANIAILVGTVAVPAFTLWLLAQGEAFPEPAASPALYQSRADCIAAAQTYDDLDACPQ